MPRHRGARERLATGVYRDARGVSVVAHVNGRQVEERHPHGTPLATLRARREALRVDARRAAAKAEAARPQAGTLAADAPAYLATCRAMPSFEARARHVALWVEALGAVRRDAITPAMVAAQLQAWRADGYAEQTCNLLRTALIQLYAVLDGAEARNPARAVPKYRIRYDDPRALPALVVARILRQFRPSSKTRARLAVIATTGLAHAELKRLQPRDVELAPRLTRDGDTFGVVIARARRKGSGAAARAVPLTRHAWRALRVFVRVQAFGDFSHHSMRSRFRDACARAGYVLKGPDAPHGLDWRPYDLRHTFATAVAQASGDERAVAEILGHAPGSAMTRRYTLGSIAPRVAAAVAALRR